ncbi:hypothetical protein GDO81_015220 [Engystomops pustulosus]|uniref:Uncharacterized protein n=1 Tax=Engystomops pustulosus TaxID=76066 RepID=A0AAV7AIA2_ENGPU|nr:hypothetical protein GDO81_015220 [Engystomops pustulosus]
MRLQISRSSKSFTLLWIHVEQIRVLLNRCMQLIVELNKALHSMLHGWYEAFVLRKHCVKRNDGFIHGTPSNKVCLAALCMGPSSQH